MSETDLPPPTPLPLFDGCHPFYTSGHAAAGARDRRGDGDAGETEADLLVEAAEEDMGDLDDGGWPEQDLIRHARLCLQVTIPVSVLSRPTPFGFRRRDEYSRALQGLVCIWWALASHRSLVGYTSEGRPLAVRALTAVPSQRGHGQVSGYLLWLWINDPDFSPVEVLNELLEKRGCDGGPKAQAAQRRNPFLQQYHGCLANWLQSLEKYSIAAKVRYLGGEAIAECLRKRTTLRIQPGSALDPVNVFAVENLAHGLPSDRDEEQSRWQNYKSVRPGGEEGACWFLPWPAHSWQLPHELSTRAFGNLRLPNLPAQPAAGADARAEEEGEGDGACTEESLLRDALLGAGRPAEFTDLLRQLRPSPEGAGFLGSEGSVRARLTSEYQRLLKVACAALEAGASWQETAERHRRAWQEVRHGTERALLTSLQTSSPAVTAALAQALRKRRSPLNDEFLPPSFYSYEGLWTENLGITDSLYLKYHDTFEHYLGASSLHQEAQLMVLSAQSAASEKFFLHLLVQGPPGTGKSYTLKKVSEFCLLPRSVLETTDMSAKALATNLNLLGSVRCLHETPPDFLGIDQKKGKISRQTETFKTMLSELYVNFEYMCVDQDSGARQNVRTKARVKSAWLMLTNTNPNLILEDLLSRVLLIHVPDRTRPGHDPWERLGGAGATLEEHESNRLATFRFTRWARDECALMTLYHRLEAVGFCPPVSLYLAGPVIKDTFQQAARFGVRRLHFERSFHRVLVLTKQFILRRALWIVFRSGVSPLIDPALGTNCGTPLGREPSLMDFTYLDAFLNDEDPSCLQLALTLAAEYEFQLPQQQEILRKLVSLFWFGPLATGGDDTDSAGGEPAGGSTHRAFTPAAPFQSSWTGGADSSSSSSSLSASASSASHHPFAASAPWLPLAVAHDLKALLESSHEHLRGSSLHCEVGQELPHPRAAAREDAENFVRRAESVKTRRRDREKKVEAALLDFARHNSLVDEAEEHFYFRKNPRFFKDRQDFRACTQTLCSLLFNRGRLRETARQGDLFFLLQKLFSEGETAPGQPAVIRQTTDSFVVSVPVILFGLRRDLFARLVAEQLGLHYGRLAPRQLYSGLLDRQNYEPLVTALLPGATAGASEPTPTAPAHRFPKRLRSRLSQEPEGLALCLRESAQQTTGVDHSGSGPENRHARALWLPDNPDAVFYQPDKQLLLDIARADLAVKKQRSQELPEFSATFPAETDGHPPESFAGNFRPPASR